MTPDEHQRERRAFWDGVCIALCPPPTPFPQMDADALLAERDKRFPAPAAAPVEPVVDRYVIGYSDGAEAVMQGMPTNAELAALRQKARLWDAVASGKLGIYPRDGDFAVHWDIGYSIRPTAAEAVESAIAQGALK